MHSQPYYVIFVGRVGTLDICVRTVYPADASMIFRQCAPAKSILTAAAGGGQQQQQDGASTRHEGGSEGGW